MKNLRVKASLIIGVTMTALSPTFGENTIGPIQDTQKAAEYFESELNFKTNSYFINRSINEKMTNINIIDVRSAESYKKGHIPGAINIPNEKYNSFDGSETDFPGLRKDAFNCVYCYTATCNLSQKAAKKFASLGYPVKEIVGGYDGWVEKKYPVETGAAK